jgi:hypothetical protein
MLGLGVDSGLFLRALTEALATVERPSTISASLYAATNTVTADKDR